jgi:hypothetical protein
MYSSKTVNQTLPSTFEMNAYGSLFVEKTKSLVDKWILNHDSIPFHTTLLVK